jgi:hypothetical protein
MSPIRTRTGVTVASLAIPYTSARFPPSFAVRSGTLSFSWSDLLWAAITIGRPNTAYVFQHGDASIHEALFRLSLVRMALEQIPFSSRLHRTDAFRALDPTEKGAVSYFLGMAVCKLFASRLLSTPWLLHLDVFRGQLNPATLGGRSRPDLVGQDASGSWHAFETKGRSSVPSSEDKQKAKEQAQRLVSVDGSACSLHIGSFAFFRGDEMEFYWRDPEPEEPEKLEPIEISVRDEDWANYYASALALASEPRRDLLSSEAQGIDLKVEIHPKVRDLLLQGQWAAARSLATEMRQMLEAEGFKPDGIRVVAGDSWTGRLERAKKE